METLLQLITDLQELIDDFEDPECVENLFRVIRLQTLLELMHA